MKQMEIIIGVIIMAIGGILIFIGKSLNDLLSKLLGVILFIAGFYVSILGVVAPEPKEKTEKDLEQKQVEPPKIL